MNSNGKQPARDTPLRYQIAHHAHELGVAPLIEPDDRFDRHAGKYAFDDHLIVDRFVEVIGRVAPANAPIVSQNYTNFAMIKPDPKTTWDQVNKLDPKTLPACQLFNPPSGALAVPNTGRAPSWGNIGK
jgi:hypothetical protein